MHGLADRENVLYMLCFNFLEKVTNGVTWIDLADSPFDGPRFDDPMDLRSASSLGGHYMKTQENLQLCHCKLLCYLDGEVASP